MNKESHLKWALVAQRDLNQIIDYVALESPDNGLQLLGKIKQKASELYTFPDGGRIVPELQDQGINIYREICPRCRRGRRSGHGFRPYNSHPLLVETIGEEQTISEAVVQTRRRTDMPGSRRPGRDRRECGYISYRGNLSLKAMAIHAP